MSSNKSIIKHKAHAAAGPTPDTLSVEARSQPAGLPLLSPGLHLSQGLVPQLLESTAGPQEAAGGLPVRYRGDPRRKPL